jgi:hypothetical protein
MKQLKKQTKRDTQLIAWVVAAILALGALLFYRLGTLTHGLSMGEIHAATDPVGWHGIYHAPLDLPLKVVRSVVFVISPGHGQTLTRLPNALFGALTIMSFSWLCWLWHGRRTALLVSALFATNAWVLHVSRYASYDVLYLWGISSLLLSHALLHRYVKQTYVWYAVLVLWGLLLTIPGMVWFLLLEIYLQRALIGKGLQVFSSWWQRLLSLIAVVLWVPLLIIDFTRSGQLLNWLGAPSHLAGPGGLLKQSIGVFIHLFVRGPENPTLWLGRAPILDAFALAMSALGIYFYATRWRTTRGRFLALSFVIGIILVALHGPVSFSVLVPLMYAAAAMGIAYLVHEWFHVFPLNPLARSLGVSLVALTVAISCLYNLRAYFVAWTNSPVTLMIFRYHR